MGSQSLGVYPSVKISKTSGSRSSFFTQRTIFRIKEEDIQRFKKLFSKTWEDSSGKSLDPHFALYEVIDDDDDDDEEDEEDGN